MDFRVAVDSNRHPPSETYEEILLETVELDHFLQHATLVIKTNTAMCCCAVNR